MNRIVVGVDGSEGSKAALWWACREAQRWNACLEVVHAWCLPALGDISGMEAATVSDAYGRTARDLLASTVQEMVGEDNDIEVRQTLVEGPPAASLLAAANDADLLVVGARGRGRIAGAILGSVSQQCTHHAPCPVVVIPSEGRA